MYFVKVYGGVEFQLRAFLKSALDGCEWSDSCSGCCTTTNPPPLLSGGRNPILYEAEGGPQNQSRCFG